MPHVAELYRWGIELALDSATLADPMDQGITFRDGVLIALFAARPVRRRTMAGLRVGEQLVRLGDGWRLALEAKDIKNRRVLATPLPKSLNGLIDHYLAEVRPRLLGKPASTAVWLEADGSPVSPQAITRMVYCRSVAEFGVRFGPHRFRHAAGTWTPIEDPKHPGLAATMLAIGASMVRKHYDRSEEAVAATAFHDALAAERAGLEPLARRIFLGEAGSAAP